MPRRRPLQAKIVGGPVVAPRADTTGKKLDPWGYVLLLILGTVFIYAQTCRYGFITEDEASMILQNPPVREGLSWAGLLWAFTSTGTGNWHPLTWLSHQLDCQLWGLHAGPPHAVNLLLQTVNALLLFFFLRRATSAPGRSFFCAALLACHPVHVESVAWITERKDLLCGFFWLLTMQAYLSAVRRPGFFRFSLVFFACLAALLTKAMAVTLPFALLLLDFWPLGRGKAAADWPRLFREKIPLFFLLPLPIWMTVQGQSYTQALVSLVHLPLSLRLENMLVSSVRYLDMFLCPWPLSFFYPYAVWLWPAVAGAALLLLLLTWLFWRLRAVEPALLTGWLWFLGVLLPINGLFQVGSRACTDHYLYLPSVGLSFILAWGGYALLKKYPAWLGPALMSFILILCLSLSFFQARNWRSSLTLYRHVLETTRPNPLVKNYLAWSLFARGADQDALAGGRPGQPRTPNLDFVYYQIGSAELLEENDPAAAIPPLETALRLQPEAPLVAASLAVAEAELGRLTEAVRADETALQLDPRLTLARDHLGEVELALGHADLAADQFLLLEKQEPGMPQAFFERATALVQLGRFPDAETEYRQALVLNPASAETHNALGTLLGRENRPTEALPEFSSALRLNPNFAVAHYNRALTLRALGLKNEADREFAVARTLDATLPTP